jgi:hypothetical protein
MTEPHKSTRLSAEEFLAKIEQAPSYAIVMNHLIGEMELIVRDEGGVEGYLGPDPVKMDTDDLVAFLEKLEALVKQDADDPESGQTAK